MRNGQFIVLSLYEVHMASAALMIDGEVVAAAHEERFTRIKNDMGFPVEAASDCLHAAGVKPEEVDVVTVLNEYFPSTGIANILFKRMALYNRDDWLKENELFWRPKLVEGKNPGRSYFDVMGGWDRVPDTHHYDLTDLDMNAEEEVLQQDFNQRRRDAVKRLLGIPADRVRFVTHYICHHYHAYYSGPLRGDDVVICHAEGDGGKYNQAVSIQSPEGLKVIAGTNQFNLGRLYQWMTLHLGMQPYGHEYKVMGLAPYSNEYELERSRAVFDRYFETDRDELVTRFRERPADLFYTFRDQLAGHRFDGIAGGLQEVLEDHLSQWIEAVVDKTGRPRVAFGGGVAMNVKANMRLAGLDSVDTFFVPLSPADESNVFGAAYGATEQHFIATGRNPDDIPSLSHPYWCPSHDSNAVKKSLQTSDISGFEVEENANVDQVASLLESGAIVARCQGAGEFGQRSLGNRSILANPSIRGTVDKINHQIKNRDFWMPFAPTVMAEHADEYLVNPKQIPSPYMTLAFDTKPECREQIREALHPADKTCRPQILEHDMNPDYHDLLSAFRQKTGIGVLLNTSFNLHGEPIVDKTEDALHVFQESELDALWLDGALVTRKPINQ
jgi:carbamoyltransferase